MTNYFKLRLKINDAANVQWVKFAFHCCDDLAISKKYVLCSALVTLYNHYVILII